MEEPQNLLFEFKDDHSHNENLEGRRVRRSPPQADDGTILTSIGNVVTNLGGSSVITKSRSRNSSSIRLGLLQQNVRWRSKQLGQPESHSATSVRHILLASFATPAAATAFLKESREVIAQWVQARAERSITFKHGSQELSLKGPDDLENLITRLQKM